MAITYIFSRAAETCETDIFPQHLYIYYESTCKNIKDVKSPPARHSFFVRRPFNLQYNLSK